VQKGTPGQPGRFGVKKDKSRTRSFVTYNNTNFSRLDIKIWRFISIYGESKYLEQTTKTTNIPSGYLT
jgi:hypothetical protein